MKNLTLSITSPQKESMGSQATKNFDAKGGTIGRASRNDWVLPEETVSSQHALISFQENDFFITDLSTNGVYINNSEVPLGTGCTVSLSNAQTLSIGLYLIAIKIEASNESQNMQPQSSDGILQEPSPILDDSFLNDTSNDPLDLLGSTSSHDPLSNNTSLPKNLFDEPQTAPYTQDQQTFENSPSSSVADAFIPPSTHTAPPESSSAIPDNWDETCFSPPVQPTKQAESEGNSYNLTKEPSPTEAPSLAVDASSLLKEDSDIASQQTLITPAISKNALDKLIVNKPEQSLIIDELDEQKPSSQFKEEISTQTESSADNIYETGQLTLAKAAFKKNGLDASLLNDPNIIDQSLALLPFVLEGILATLRSRSEIKNELRASQTIIQKTENNPLKFSINLQDAFQNLLVNQRPGFLSPEDAIKQSFQDLTQHEAALIMGIQTGLNAMLKKISPEAIETKIESLETKKNIFGKISSAKKWDYYKETYQHITENSSNSFIDMFGDDFVKGYEAYISNNKHYGK